MPTYRYHCTKCGYEFEKFQNITEGPVPFCPKCDGRIKRVITGGAGFLLKGNGFYQTDYRSEKYKSDARKDTPATSKSSTSNSSDSSQKKSNKDNKT